MPTIIQPQFDKIAVRLKQLRQPDEIIIPDAAQNSQAMLPYGEVIAVGPDCKTTQIGDRVIVLPNNYIGFIDPENPEIPAMCILLTSEQNVMGKYVEVETALP